jgi:hypothetical protein
VPSSIDPVSLLESMPPSTTPPSSEVQVPLAVSHAPVVQSASAAHEVLQLVASAHTSEPGQGVAAPGTHAVVVPEQ